MKLANQRAAKRGAKGILKRCASILLTFLLIASMLVVSSVSVGAKNAIKTQAEAVAWLNQQGGKSYNIDTGTSGTQCVEFVKVYVNYLLNGDPWKDAWGRGTGNACDVWKNSIWKELGWTVYTNSFSFMPMPGDIFVVAGNSSYGHTGVVISSDIYNAKVADSNVDKPYNGTPVKIHTVNWSGSYSPKYYIRPNFTSAHTHNYNIDGGYQQAHPHYKIKKCSCGQTQTTQDTTKVNSCCLCYPVGKATPRSDKSLYFAGESAIISWSSPTNANSYVLCLYKMDSSGEYKSVKWTERVYSTQYVFQNLSAGTYRVYHVSYDTTRRLTDGSDYSYTKSDYIYFTVIDLDKVKYRVAGTPNLCGLGTTGEGWDPNDDSNLMTYNKAKNRFEKVYYNVPKSSEPYTFKITMYDPDYYSDYNGNIRWFPDDGDIGNTFIYVKDYDYATITVYYIPGDERGYFEMTKGNPPKVEASSVKLNEETASLEVGGTLKLTATVMPDNASDKTVTWSTDNEGVASVKDGNVTAKSEGVAKITAKTANGKSASCMVTVKKKLDTNAPQIVVDSKTAQAGANVTVNVSIKNNPGINGWAVDIEYDTNIFELVSVDNGDFSNVTTSEEISSNPYRIQWYSLNDDKTNGALIKLNFKIKENVKDGTYPITLTYDKYEICNEKDEMVHFDVVNGEIKVASRLPGDVNSDGRVNLRDVVRLNQSVAGWNVDIADGTADINGDGRVNLRDVIRLNQYVAGWQVDIN